MCNDIRSVVSASLCIGCGVCPALCPTAAIEMHKTALLHFPRIDEDKCIQCGICLKVCPGRKVEFDKLAKKYLNSDKSEPSAGHYSEVFLGKAADEDLRRNASAGGGVTAVLSSLLRTGAIDGALAVRFEKANSFSPECYIAKNIAEVEESIGSKYCPVSISAGLLHIANNEGKYAVVGLPCHLHGIRTAMAMSPKLEEKIVLCIGLFCSGTKTFLSQEYICKRFGIHKNGVTAFSYRTGDPTSARFCFEDGTIITVPYRKYNRPLKGFFLPSRCNLCIDQYAELADISAGDIHLPGMRSDGGITAMIARSGIGIQALQCAVESGELLLEELDLDMLLGAQRKMAQRKKLHVPVRLWMRRLVGLRNPEYDNMKPCFKGICRWRASLAYLVSAAECFVGRRMYMWWIIDILGRKRG